ncbi:MAG: (2Fe-2S)-binding protein [Thermoprotei archaeon]|nr:MAG: (2Fe-2S)-binding protein [Thermoprotei archaeon]
MIVSFKLNGELVEVDVPPNMTLLDVLRRKLGILSVKRGCERGECGACTVLINGDPVCSCLVLAPQAEGKEIITLEYLSKNGEIHPIQEAFIEAGAIQCGFCTPGFILTAYALLKRNPNPTIDEIKKALEGNLCRCTGYIKIIEAIQLAAKKLQRYSR